MTPQIIMANWLLGQAVLTLWAWWKLGTNPLVALLPAPYPKLIKSSGMLVALPLIEALVLHYGGFW